MARLLLLHVANLIKIVPFHETMIVVPYSNAALVKARIASTSGARIRHQSFTDSGEYFVVVFLKRTLRRSSG